MVLRATRQHIEALYPGSGKLRATHQNIEVLIPVNPEAYASHTINFEEEIYNIHVIGDFWPVSHTLDLQQTIKLFPFEWASNTISLSQVAVGTGSIKRIIHQGLLLSDTARSRNIYIDVEDTIEFTEIIPQFFEVSVTDTISLLQSIPRKDSVTDTIILVQTITVGKHHSLPVQEMDLSGTVSVSGVWTRSIDENINIAQTVAFYYIDSCTKKAYSPFIGESDDESIDPELPFIQDSNEQFRLEYPALGSVVDTVLLKAPELDNVDQVSATRINRETRGGELNIFADPIWPEVHTLKVSFNGLTTVEASDLQTFIYAHLGKDILLTDWEGREWIGVIISPDEPIIQDNENRWSASFTFEGKLLDSCTPDSGLSLEESVSVRGDWHRKPSVSLDFVEIIACRGDWSRGAIDDLDLGEIIGYEVV